MSELVHVETADGLATLVLDSPHNRNALSRALTGQLLDALDRVAAADAVRVVLLRSSGPVFCSGADMREAVAEGMEVSAGRMVALQRRLVALPQPVVVRLDGPVRAGGLGLVGAADVVVAAESVTFAFTEVRLGLAAATISLTTLPRIADRAAAWSFLGGESFDAAEAERIGLVTKAVPDAETDDAVTAIVAALLQGSPQGLRETKRVLTTDLLAHIDARGDEMAALSARLFASAEARTAMQAFLGPPAADAG